MTNERPLWQRIAQGVFTVAALTLVAKALSFVKDTLVARGFGISDDLDAFNVAFGVWAFVVAQLGSGLPMAMIPLFAKRREQAGEQAAARFALQSSLLHLVSALACVAIVFVAATPIIGFMTRGFSPEKQALAVRCLYDLAPSAIMLGMTLQLAAWLRGKMLFAVAALAPALVPITIIAYLGRSPGDVTLAHLITGTNVGSVLSTSVLVAMLLAGLPRSFAWWRDSLSDWGAEHRAALTSGASYVLSALIIGAAPVIDQLMAAWLGSGSVSTLAYSDKICGIVLTLATAAVADTLFPYISQAVAEQRWADLRVGLRRMLLSVLGVVVPFTLLLAWQAPQIVSLLFERGAFTSVDTARVAAVVRFAALQIPFYVSGVIMARTIVALGAHRFTVVTTVVALVMNVICNQWLMRHFGVPGIALSTAIVYLTSSLMMLSYLQKKLRSLA